jgi:nitrite reductase/ring-hydroxylating ferredoxin subunit
MAMSTALSLYVASAAARARGSRRAGKALGLAGFAVLSAGGYLGGHLSFVLGVNVNRTAWQDGPREWTAVLADADLTEGEHRKVDAAGIPILLYRTAGRLCALASTCSHMGGPLDEGAVSDGCVTCPWHGSIFRFADGGIVRGPASTPQPLYDAQIRDGQSRHDACRRDGRLGCQPAARLAAQGIRAEWAQRGSRRGGRHRSSLPASGPRWPGARR